MIARTLPVRLVAFLYLDDGRFRWLSLALLCLAGAAIGGFLVMVLGGIYAAAIVVALVAGLLMLRHTDWSMAFLICIILLLPFAALPMLKSMIGLTPTFLDIVLILLFFVWLSRLITGRQRKITATSLGLPVLLFLVFAVFAFALGISHARPTTTILRRFVELLLGIALFFAIVNNVRSLERISNLVRVIMLAGAGAALVAIVLYVIPETWTVRLFSILGRLDYPTGVGVLRYIEDNPDNPMRAIGTSLDPNVLGGAMVLVGGLTAPQLFSDEPLFDRRIIIAMLGAQVLCLYLTYSRSSLGGLAVAIIVLAVLKYRRLLWVGLVGLIMMLVLPQTQEYLVHLVEGLLIQDLATQMRLGEYKDALILISRHPWLGVGFSGTPEIDVYLGVSNVYLLMAEEMGVVGVGIFVLTMVMLFRRLWSFWRGGGMSSRAESILLGLGAALAGVLAAGVLDHYLFNLTYPHMTALFWIYVGLAVALTEVVLRVPEGTRRNMTARANTIGVDAALHSGLQRG